MDEVKKKEMPEYFRVFCFYYKSELLEKANMELFKKEMMCNFEPENENLNGEQNE